ncbi:MAG: accessory factor UbiK family protein [Rickettsiales bacterium]
MNKDKKFFNDVTKMAGDAFATMLQMKNEVSTLVKEQIKSSLKGMDFVTRGEFNILKKTVADVSMQLQQLGGQTMKKKPAAKKAVAKKPAKKTVAKKAPAKKKKK